MRKHKGVRARLRAAGTISLPLVAVLAGCGSSSAVKLDNAALERSIAESILTQRHVYTLVSCPAEPQREGITFTCKAMLTVGTYPITVTETDGSGHVRYGNQVALVALDTTKVARAIKASVLAQRGLHVRVVCPSNVLQQKGLAFACTVKSAGKSYRFEVTETNDHGHVRYIGR